MKVTALSIPDILLIEPKVFRDNRGLFFESFNQGDFEKRTNLSPIFVQENHSRSIKGVLRGLHYQLPPFAQTKLVSVLQGTVLDVVVDVRKGSPTFGQHIIQELSAENHLQLFIPRGFAHGFITLSKTSVFMYKVDQFYNFKSEGSISPNDLALGIDWQLPQSDWIQSEKDKKHPTLAEATLFDYNKDLYA